MRLYYGFTDAPCSFLGFDNLATGERIRFEPKAEGDVDDAKAKLRQDIHSIVMTAEEKSKHTCEFCGAEGKLRNDLDIGFYWINTLCDSCHERLIKGLEERKKEKQMSSEDVSNEIKKKDEE